MLRLSLLINIGQIVSEFSFIFNSPLEHYNISMEGVKNQKTLVGKSGSETPSSDSCWISQGSACLLFSAALEGKSV